MLAARKVPLDYDAISYNSGVCETPNDQAY